MRQASSHSDAPANASDVSSLPVIMNDEELQQAIAARRPEETGDPNRRKDRPDPWPIIERFPRIAERIRALWGNAILDDYFAKLVLDGRGGREGFPPEVMEAILEVALLHSQRFGFTKAMRSWEADITENKWRDKSAR